MGIFYYNSLCHFFCKSSALSQAARNTRSNNFSSLACDNTFNPASVVPPLDATRLSNSSACLPDCQSVFAPSTVLRQTNSASARVKPIASIAFNQAEIIANKNPGPLPLTAVALSISTSVFTYFCIPIQLKILTTNL